MTTVDAVCRTGGLGWRCQEVAKQTCTVAFEGRQVMCFEITVGPCEFAAWVTYWWYDPFIFNTFDTYCLPQVLLTQENPLAEVSQLLPGGLHTSQHILCSELSFFPFCQRNSREGEGEILDQEGTHRDGQGCACCRALCAPLFAPLHRGWSHQLTKSRLGGLSCWGPSLLMGYCKLMHIR